MRKLLATAVGALALVAAMSAPAAAATSGSQTFVVAFRNTTGSVAAYGVVNGSGSVANVVPEVINPDFTFVETDRLTLSGGTIDVRFAGQVNPSAFSPDPRTCVAKTTGSGNWTIVGGTGAYAGASGGGTFTFPAYLFYGPTAQGCTSEPTLTLAFVTAVGNVSVANAAAAA